MTPNDGTAPKHAIDGASGMSSGGTLLPGGAQLAQDGSAAEELETPALLLQLLF